MSSLYLSLPRSALGAAAARMRGRMQRSAKRRYYGLPAALDAADLHEEAMLVDSHDHAGALIGSHVELLSLDPESAAYIHVGYIGPDQTTVQLAATLQSRGMATVEQQPGQHNLSGWATLRPLINDGARPPAPYRKSDGKLNVYLPDWHPDVDIGVARAVVATHPLVRDDETLGRDVTPLTGVGARSAEDARGRIWSRRDGIGHIERAANVAADAPVAMTFTAATPETGLYVTQPGVVDRGGGAIDISLGNVNNWFLRWLGMWVRFYGPDPATGAIPASQLPADTLGNAQGARPPGSDTVTALFAGMLPPVDTVAGIPFSPGTLTVQVKKPPQAASMEVLYGGLGKSGSLDDPENLRMAGENATVFFNYFIVGLYMVAGASGLSAAGSQFFDLCLKGLLAELQVIRSAVGNNKPVSPEALVMAFCKTVFDTGASTLIGQIMKFVLAELASAEIIDSVPAVGTIARAVSVTIGAVKLAETTVEIALSPPLYRFNLVLTHTLSTVIQPQRLGNGPGRFPTTAAGEILYYRVSYLFDNGTPHLLEPVDVAGGSAAPIPVTLSGIPLGGRVNIVVGFYIRKAGTPAGQNDWCAAQGSTGLVDNNGATAPGIEVQNVRKPIQASTVYIHTGKTALDASGRHLWLPDPDGSHAPAYLPPPGDQQPSLGGLRAITVRQDRYVGYAWKAYSGARRGCGSDAPGQFDYAANVGAFPGNAEQGYASIACGLAGGSTLGYSLLSDAANVYLDPDQLFLRPVTLGDASAFPSPASGLALGQLNLASSTLLLHPSGQLVSINNEHSKLEMLRLPARPVDEASASRLHLARTYAGAGSRPGLMRSPVAAAVSSDGVILVLEGSDGNNRIQAFDAGGNPVPYFSKQPRPYFLQLPDSSDALYLDLAVEYSGYLYVLSSGDSDAHRLDIYHAGQAGAAPICSTTGINAARLAVDFWCNLYTLNYEVLRLPDGSIPATLTEPSISFWAPPAPA